MKVTYQCPLQTAVINASLHYRPPLSITTRKTTPLRDHTGTGWKQHRPLSIPNRYQYSTVKRVTYFQKKKRKIWKSNRSKALVRPRRLPRANVLAATTTAVSFAPQLMNLRDRDGLWNLIECLQKAGFFHDIVNKFSSAGTYKFYD